MSSSGGKLGSIWLGAKPTPRATSCRRATTLSLRKGSVPVTHS